MLNQLIALDPQSRLSLGEQIQAGITDAVIKGYFPSEKSLPSSRKLSQTLNVARNTVIRAYEQLVEDGILISRERSGYYPNPGMVNTAAMADSPPLTNEDSVNWATLITNPAEQSSEPIHDDWRTFTYPFVYGQVDSSMFPANEWRKCSLRVLNRKSCEVWTGDQANDDELIEHIRTRILPRRGILVNRDQILITLGSQQALFILAHLFKRDGLTVGIEEPGYPEARKVFEAHHARLCPLDVDSEGLMVDDKLAQCDLVYTTPSHQLPTTVTLSDERRHALLAMAEKHNLLIIEDDYEHETNYLDSPVPALKSRADAERVIYISSLSRVLAPGLRIGFMVASPAVIQHAKTIRSLMIRQPPANNVSSLSLFLSMGYYDALMQKLIHAYRQKWQVMEDSLNYYFPQYNATPAFGGTAFWIEGPPELDANELQRIAKEHSILIEPGDRFFSRNNGRHCFRLGFAAIPIDRIREGIAQLARLMNKLLPPEHIDNAVGIRYRGDALRQLLNGCQVLASDCYHVPYLITFQRDGQIHGIADHPNDEDEGYWWIKDDRWYRQWRRWQFAEERSFAIVVHGEIFKWFDESGWCVNQGILNPKTTFQVNSEEVLSNTVTALPG